MEIFMQKIILSLVLGAIATVAYGCRQGGVAAPNVSDTSAPQVQTETQASSSTLIAVAGSQSGRFVDGDHPTQGTARIVTANPPYLEFDQGFKTDQGPDLFVLLHRQSVPKNYQANTYVNLGRLKQVNGSQRYTIPADIDLGEFKSVVIWCRQFNATFGYAPLKS